MGRSLGGGESWLVVGNLLESSKAGMELAKSRGGSAYTSNIKLYLK